MQQPVFESIYPQLKQLEQQLNKDFKLRKGTIFDYVSLPGPENNPADFYLPALLMLIYAKGSPHNSKNIVKISSVCQHIFLGTKVHFLINNQEIDTQFPILVGDYLYGKFCTNLCEAEGLKYLAPLSQAIKKIHEASTLEYLEQEHMDRAALISLYEAKWGAFFGLCCSIGVEFKSKCQKEHHEAYAIGSSLGGYYGLLNSKLGDIDLIIEAREKVMALINKTQDSFIMSALVFLVNSLYNNGAMDDTKRKSALVG